ERAVARNEHERVVFERVGECGVDSVITRACSAARIFFISRFGFGAPIHIEPNLMDIRKHAHLGIGKTAAEPAGGIQRNWNGDRSFDNEISVAFTGEIEDGSLAREETALGRSEEHTSELQSLRHLVCRLLLEKKNQRCTACPARNYSPNNTENIPSERKESYASIKSTTSTQKLYGNPECSASRAQ